MTEFLHLSPDNLNASYAPNATFAILNAMPSCETDSSDRARLTRVRRDR